MYRIFLKLQQGDIDEQRSQNSVQYEKLNDPLSHYCRIKYIIGYQSL